jgi:hypothetical protein
MAEGFSRAFFPSGVSLGANTEVLGPDVPTTFFKMSSTDLLAPANCRSHTLGTHARMDEDELLVEFLCNPTRTRSM